MNTLPEIHRDALPPAILPALDALLARPAPMQVPLRASVGALLAGRESDGGPLCNAGVHKLLSELGIAKTDTERVISWADARTYAARRVGRAALRGAHAALTDVIGGLALAARGERDLNSPLWIAREAAGVVREAVGPTKFDDPRCAMWTVYHAVSLAQHATYDTAREAAQAANQARVAAWATLEAEQDATRGAVYDAAQHLLARYDAPEGA